MAYATPANVYARALPAAALAARPKTIESATTATGVLTLTGHGLSEGSALRFSIEGQAVFGAAANALPGGLSLATMYEAVPVDGNSDLFRVRLPGGATIASFSSAPVGSFAVVIDPLAMLLEQLEDAAGIIDEHLTAHSPPLVAPYPAVVVGVNARLAARACVTALGTANPQYADAMKRLFDSEERDWAMLAAWKAGKTIWPVPEDQTPGVIENAARATYTSTAAGWETGAL